MAETTLQGFIDELIPVIRAVADINFVPDDPSEQLPAFPAAIIYTSGGRAVHGPATIATYYANVTIAVVSNVLDLPHAHRIMLPKIEPICEAIITQFHGAGFTGLENIPSMEWTFGASQWGGIDVLGFFITLDDVKYQRIATS